MNVVNHVKKIMIFLSVLCFLSSASAMITPWFVYFSDDFDSECLEYNNKEDTNNCAIDKVYEPGFADRLEEFKQTKAYNYISAFFCGSISIVLLYKIWCHFGYIPKLETLLPFIASFLEFDALTKDKE